jgi:hypothetical protein
LVKDHVMGSRVFLVVLAGLVAVAAGCGHDSRRDSGDSAAIAAAKARSRPIGGGPRFVPPSPSVRVQGCRASLGSRYGVHLELFAANRVVLIPAGVGTEPPRATAQGRITRARCYGSVVTTDPTGLLLVRKGTTAKLGDLFREWRVRFGPAGFLTFRGRMRAYVGGRPWRGDPRAIPLARHAVIVIEVGPYVPPHTHYAFPDGV